MLTSAKGLVASAGSSLCRAGQCLRHRARSGLLLFDTGLGRASVSDDVSFAGGLTGLIYHRLARFGLGEQDTLTGQLRVLGYALSDVSTAILSHLHEHHIGGIAEQTAAGLRVSAAGRQICPRSGPEPRGFLRDHIQIPGSKWH
jgi:N-acyl homoserine lactone hydrolase